MLFRQGVDDLRGNLAGVDAYTTQALRHHHLAVGGRSL